MILHTYRLIRHPQDEPVGRHPQGEPVGRHPQGEPVGDPHTFAALTGDDEWLTILAIFSGAMGLV